MTSVSKATFRLIASQDRSRVGARLAAASIAPPLLFLLFKCAPAVLVYLCQELRGLRRSVVDFVEDEIVKTPAKCSTRVQMSSSGEHDAIDIAEPHLSLVE